MFKIFSKPSTIINLYNRRNFSSKQFEPKQPSLSSVLVVAFLGAYLAGYVDLKKGIEQFRNNK
jgi:hypothetical protein